MRNIPSEILNGIFIFLSQEDQIECMLVCHFWKDIMEQLSLFQTLRIYSTDSLENYIKKIQDKPNVGCNVEKLTCYFDNSSEVNLTKLLEQLSNLREFNCFGPEYGSLLIDDGTKFSWYRSIENMSEQVSKSIVNHLFATGICPNLTVLSVCDYDNEIIPLLKNAPALKNLTLCYGEIDFGDITAIHDTLPNLQTLSLKSATLFADRFDKYTAPAKSITEFNLGDVTTDSFQVQIDLLRYIKIKYPYLLHLSHNTGIPDNNNDKIEQLNKQGWFPLFQSLGSQLKKLHIHYTDQFQNFLEILDINRCEIQTLYLKSLSSDTTFPNISHSRQILSIKTLVLNNLRPDSFDWLRELEVLESLDIQIATYAKSLRFNFNDFIQNCPDSLLSLSLTNANITVELTNAIQCNVETLILMDCNLPQKIDWFIYRHFPFLSNLALDNCGLHARKFDMKSIDLQTFRLIENRNDTAVTVLIRTFCDFEQRWYSTRGIESYYPFMYATEKFNPLEFPPVISRPASEIKEKPYFTLYCHSLGRIFLCR